MFDISFIQGLRVLSHKGVGGSKWLYMIDDGGTDIGANEKSCEKLLVRVEPLRHARP